MRASLPMYDHPELKAAQVAYWTAIHQTLQNEGIESPPKLDANGIGLDFWQDPSLVFSQTCGLPYRKYLHDKVNLVGTPDFSIEGCPEGYYRSYFIVRRSETQTDLNSYLHRTFAYNEKDSQSGYAAAWNHLKPQKVWFHDFLETGSHIESARNVALMKADIASIDALIWRLIERYEDFACELRLLEKTAPTPGLPYITSLGIDNKVVQAAVINALHGLDADVRQILGIRNIVSISKARYLSVPLV